MSIEFQQEKRWIDGVPGGAGDFRNDFVERMRDCFSDEEATTGRKKGILNIDYLNHIPQNVMDSLIKTREGTIDGDTLSIEVTIQNQLFALLYDKRTQSNHSELAYFINKDMIEQRRENNYSLKDEIDTSFSSNTLAFHHTRNTIDGVSEDTYTAFIEHIKTYLTGKYDNIYLEIKHYYHIPDTIKETVAGGKKPEIHRDRHIINTTIGGHLVALFYEKKDDTHTEYLYFINAAMIHQEKLREYARIHGYDGLLPIGLSFESDISDEDFDAMQIIMKSENLSRYELDKKNFLIIKDRNNKIVAFGRLYSIGEGQKEISSLWVDPEERGSKLGLYLSKKLIDEKKGDDDLYLATRLELGGYYEKLGFHTIDTDIPEKLVHTGIWAKSQGIEFIIMKYM